MSTKKLFHSQDRYKQVLWQLSHNMDIPDGAIPWNNDEATKESSNYGVPHQVKYPTNRRFDMGRVLHTKVSTTNQALGTTLVEGHIKP